MSSNAQKLFYGLAMFILLNALFVMQDGASSEIRNWKLEIREQFRLAFWQTWTDKSVFAGLEMTWSGIEEFYEQSADVLIALIEPRPEEDGMNEVLAEIWNGFKGVKGYKGDMTVADDQGRIAGLSAEARAEAGLLWDGEFMQEEPLRNLVPWESIKDEVLSIKGAQTLNTYNLPLNTNQEPANAQNQWVTVQDNYTGQLYCLAIYNNEVNKYLGPCVYDN